MWVHKQCGPRSDCSFSLMWVHTVCLYAKIRFEKFAKIFSRRHKQTTFSDAGFLGALRVNLHFIAGTGRTITLTQCRINVHATGYIVSLSPNQPAS